MAATSIWAASSSTRLLQPSHPAPCETAPALAQPFNRPPALLASASLLLPLARAGIRCPDGSTCSPSLFPTNGAAFHSIYLDSILP